MKTRRLLALLMTLAMLLSLLGPSTALADDEVTFDEPDVIELPDGGLLEEDGEEILSGLSLDLMTEDIDPAAVTEDVEPAAVVEEVKPVYCTVSFDAQGGQPAPEAQTVEAGGFAAKPDDPTLEGHAFTGWFLDGADYFADPALVTGDVTLTAGWEAVPQEEPAEEEPAEEAPQEEEEIPEGGIEIVEEAGEEQEADETEETFSDEGDEQEQPEADEVIEFFEETEAETEESLNAAVTENSVAKIGDNGYDTLQDAFDDAVEGDTIQVLKNIEGLTATVNTSADESVTLDLNGYTISSNDQYTLTVKGGLTVTDTSAGKTGSIVSVSTKTYSAAIFSNGGTKSITVNAGTIQSKVYGIYTNGLSASVTINGGTVIGESQYGLFTSVLTR